MKRILIIFLALILVACGVAPAATTQQPVAGQPEPSQTPVVVVITATNAPPTEVPPTEPPPPTEVPPTAVPPTAVPPTAAAPTEAVAAPTQAAAPAAGTDLITVDEKLGAGWFVNMTRSRNDFSLRCQLNKELTFNVQVTSDDIRSVDLWYRFEDRATGAIFEWTNFGKMVPDLEGGYTITISGDQTNPNFRKPNSYFDYQFVAYNPNGVIGRSEKIERQVTFTFDCP